MLEEENLILSRDGLELPNITNLTDVQKFMILGAMFGGKQVMIRKVFYMF